MRVTELTYYNNLVKRLQHQQSKMQRAGEELSSGSRLQRPSDDPIASAAVERLQASRERHQTFMKVQNELRGELEQAEGALEAGSQVVEDALVLAVQMTNSIYTEEVMKSAAGEVAMLRVTLLEAANARYQGRYMFGGVADQQAPFDQTGTYQGSVVRREVQIGDQQRLTQLGGAEIFSAQGVSIFEVFDQLEEALNNADPGAVSGTLDQLRAGLTSLVGGRQELGYQLNRVDHAQAFSETMVLAGVTHQDRLESADVAEAASRMQLASVALQASIEIAQRINGLKEMIFKL